MSLNLSKLRTLIVNAPVRSFYLLAFLFSWLIWTPAVWACLSQGAPLWSWGTIPFIIAGTYAPSLAAILVTGLTSGRAEVGRLSGKLTRGRVPFVWYLVAIFYCVTINFVLALIVWPFLKDVSLEVFIGFVLSALIAAVINVLIKLPTGPLGEELGWRGFAIPRLQLQFQNATLASLFHGVLWTLWHLPIMVFPEWRAQLPFVTYLGLYALILLPLCIILTWILNHTRGSVLLAIIAHAAFNGSMMVLLVMLGVDKQLGLIPLLLMLAAGLWAFAIVLIAVCGPKHLSRKADFRFEDVL